MSILASQKNLHVTMILRNNITQPLFDEPKHLLTLYALHSQAPLLPQQLKLEHQCEVKVAPNLTVVWHPTIG
jgi:hypothetical protein